MSVDIANQYTTGTLSVHYVSLDERIAMGQDGKNNNTFGAYIPLV